MAEFQKTTGKIYKDKSLICVKCNAIVIISEGDSTSWANTKCKKCGCTNLIRNQQTTAKI